MERYVNFITSDKMYINTGSLSKSQLKTIKSKLNQKWFTNIMMKRKVQLIDDEVMENYRIAEKRAIVDYVLLDPSERVRVNVLEVPHRFKTSLIRAPVPWKTNYIVAWQYCRHNLFITNCIVQRIRVAWEKRFMAMRFVNTNHLRSRNDDPLSPEEMHERIIHQCKQTKDYLTSVSFGDIYVSLRKKST